MSYLRLYGLKCLAVVFAAHVFAMPAVADQVRSGGFLVVGTKPQNLLHKSQHQVHRYYGVTKEHKPEVKVHHKGKKPKVHLHKSKPRVYYRKPVKRHHRSAHGFRKKHVSPYYIPKRYGIRHRGFKYYKRRH